MKITIYVIVTHISETRPVFDCKKSQVCGNQCKDTARSIKHFCINYWFVFKTILDPLVSKISANLGSIETQTKFPNVLILFMKTP